MKKFTILLILSIFLLCMNSAKSQISGTVFRDYNGNGVKDNTATFNEPFVAGVTVTATLANGTSFTTTTSATGAYSFTALQIPNSTAARIEFSGLATGEFNSFNGSGNGTDVQFATGGQVPTVNYAFNLPGNYVSNTNPKVIIPSQHNGTGTGGTAPAIVRFDYNLSGTATPPTTDFNNSQLGTLWGTAYQKTTKRLFAAAMLRRHAGLGPRGMDGIYIMDYNLATPAIVGGFDLEGVTPSNGGAAISLGTVTRSSVTGAISAGAAGDNQLSNNPVQRTRDLDAFGKVARTGYGDIDFSEDDSTLWIVNLFQRALIKVNTSNLTMSVANPNLLPTTQVAQYPFSGMTGAPVDNALGLWRPWGLGFRAGRGYIGFVNDASLSATRYPGSGQEARVYSFNPNSPVITLTLELSFSLNFNRESGYAPTAANTNLSTANWQRWMNVWNAADVNSPTSFQTAPQPILTDISFTGDGKMMLGMMDRWAYQGGEDQYEAVSGSTNQLRYIGAGDLLYATQSGGIWTVEPTDADPGAAANTITGLNGLGNDGPGNDGEFFYGDVFITPANNGEGHYEVAAGSVTVLPGTNEILSSVFDPTEFYSQGVRYFNETNGTTSRSYRTKVTTFGNPQDFGKTACLGDIELLVDPSPIQIGNRIWLDANGNGVQDAGETTAGVPTGTTVTLRSPGVDGIYGNGDDQTWTTTTDANGNYYFSALSSADNRKPTSWTGIGNTILPGFNYRIEVATPTGTQVTNVNAASNTVDNIDNDAVANGTNAFVTFNTGNTNHNFDIGFKTLASIGDRVWLDNGVGSGTANDGVQNGTEPGVAGVTVTLYQNGADGLPSTADDIVIGSTVTDAFGIYLFDNLTPSTNAATSYNVGFTLPANHQFTTQTNTQVTGTSNATNTTTTSGGSTAINGSDANSTTGRTGSFWLAPGEAERAVDAGLIFNTLTLLNSLGDRVWFDNGLGGGTAGNGVQDGTEPGVAGVTVQLLDDITGAVIATTVTDANGNYIFTGLPANTNYKVKVLPPAGTVFTTTTGTTPGNATTNSDVNATLSAANYGITTTVNTGAAGTQITGIDAGIVSQVANTASLGDKVWNDLNSNGTQEAVEPGIAGVTVNLYEDANGDGALTGGELVPVRTTITDAFGHYIFNNLVVTGTNTWQVEFVQPVGFNNTPIANNNSGNDATDSDIINNTTDRTGFIRLKFDERNTTVDAGFVQASPAGSLVLGDRVWRDNNANGQQDAGEPGVAGVTARLYQNGPDGLPGTADDVLLGTTTTDINGNYQFVNLAASTNAATNYNVQFGNIPSGFVFTTQDAGADASDSDVNSLGVTNSINLTANNQTIDAGITQGIPSGLGSLGDKVWYDLDNDGVQDAGELGVAGVAVNLFRDVNNDGIISGAELTPIATTTTNPLGEYMFTNLPAGTYQVGFTLPTALSTYALSARDAVAATDATDSDGNPKNTSIAGNTAGAQTSYTGLIALGQGQDNVTVDLGIVPPANTNTLGGTAWFDTDSDGSQTGNPGRVPGVLVTLYNSAGVAIATTTTDENGDYLFVGLTDGDYSVGFSNYPTGFDLTTKSTTNDATGSDADRVSGRTPTVTLNVGNRNDRSLDAGLISTRAALGNRVWDDLNGDGIQDANEPGIAGVQVILYASDGITVLASSITDQNGNYLFANLDAGNYIVGVNPATIPTGMQFTTQNNIAGPDGDGANTWTGGGDSDVTNTGFTTTISLAAGQVNLTVDAGVRRTPIATVGNRVWDDLNGNGIQDAGEPGVSGVVATLYNNANQPIGSAVTDGNGNWLITNVPTGMGYYVIFTNKPAGNWTLQDQGANGAGTGGATESDADSDVNTITGQTGTFDVTPNTINVRIDAGILQSITLPVKFTSFTATKQVNTSVLNFVIAQAVPNSRFTIERSATGLNFIPIGIVQGTQATNYTYTDIAPELNAKNYYRIKEVDAQGRISYSEIRIVKFNNDGKVDIYPIPASTNLSITFGDEVINKPIVISLYNNQGQALMQKQVSRANATEMIDVANITNGTYQLRITSNNIVITNRKIVIMK